MGSDFLRLNGKKVLVDEPDLIGIDSKQYSDNDILTYKQLSELVKEPEDKLRQKDCFILFGNNYKSRLLMAKDPAITDPNDPIYAFTKDQFEAVRKWRNEQFEKRGERIGKGKGSGKGRGRGKGKRATSSSSGSPSKLQRQS